MLYTLPGAFATSGGTVIIGGGSMGLAPNDATYVTLSTNATLLNERVLTAGTGIALTDGGAGSTITVDVDATLVEILTSGNTTGGVDVEVTAGDALLFNENAAVPWTPAAGKGCIWVKDTTPNTVFFTDDAGTDFNLATGGETLAQTLAIGNTTGGTDLEVSAADALLFVENAAVPWTPAATKGCIWVKNTTPNTVFFTDDAGTDFNLATGGETLAQTLAIGNTTGGTGLEVSAADPLLLNENASVPWTPAAGKGAIWIKNDAPNTLWFTDDAGTDFQLGIPAVTDTLAATLVAGNTSGGTDVEVSAGDALLLVENAAVPWTPAATKGCLWIKNDAPNTLWFTDDAGTDHQLAAAETWATTLGAGNTSGGTDVEISAGDALLLNENASVPWTPAAAKGAIWVKTATPNELWFTDDAGTDFQLGIPAVTDSLATTLAAGSTSGGTDLEMSAGDALLLNENASVPWTPAAAKGCIWVKNDAPNTLWFTDDAGTDFQLGAGGGGGTALDANATSENLYCARTAQTPTVTIADPGQVNLGSESVAAHGTKADYATIGGGLDNLIAGNYGTVSGGQDNDISSTGAHNTIGGGFSNVISGTNAFGTIAGGDSHTISAAQTVICGGSSNNVSALRSSVVGGYTNTISHASATYSAVVGGENNNISATASHQFVGGGKDAVLSASGMYNAIVSGLGNTISGTCDNATIVNGSGNTITNSDLSTIAGGATNSITGGKSAFIGGGQSHTIPSANFYATIGGGFRNDIQSGQASVIAGGQDNEASAGGQATIGGGNTNIITGTSTQATIPGGHSNTITDANYAVACGRRAKVNHAGTFVFADGTDADVASVAANEFHVGVANGIRLSHTTEEDGAVKVVAEAATSDDTETTMWSLTLGDDTAVYVSARVVCMETDGSNRNVYEKRVLVYRNGGGATIQGAVQDIVVIESDAAWDCDFDVDTNDVRLRITGGAATTNVNWRATVEYQQVS